ncbi:MAG: UDP-glucuronic acid dehydrogenase [Betaproteobacteria bacterium]|nr:UDP-glucuronic acid dehydrogenase [Betaproteobacteria bacterium]
MRISILCSDPRHPVFPHLKEWADSHKAAHAVELVHETGRLSGGDMLFLVSCSELVDRGTRGKFRYSLVIHASDLPVGRGWSPHIWQVLEGKRRITVTLLEAGDQIDAGPIWAQEAFELEGHELADEINSKLFAVELSLMDFAVSNAGSVAPQAQNPSSATYYRKRTPEDSRLDPESTLAAQFDLLRVADPVRYPAFFEHRGHRYIVRIEKQRTPK